uniref:hypothetical protein n=1 Tax=Klebsiella oxytoca TaxID=571 RepID=UPI00292E42ED|nr:hypothetical protein [Klebsiella oxytoca]
MAQGTESLGCHFALSRNRPLAGVGSSTEKMLGYVAEAVFENCGQLDNQQLDDIISWIQLYKS